LLPAESTINHLSELFIADIFVDGCCHYQ